MCTKLVTSIPACTPSVAQAGGLSGTDAVLDDGMLAVQHVDELDVPAARDAFQPFVRDIGAGDRVLPAGLLLLGGEVLQVPAGRPDPADDPAEPGRPVPDLLIRPVISATSLSSSACPSWVMPGFQAPAGISRMSASSVSVMVHPLANSSLPPRIRGHHVCDEGVAGAGAVEADQDPGPVWGRDLEQRGRQPADMVGGGVGAGVPGPQLHRHRLVRVHAPRAERVEAFSEQSTSG
jgi:hypothetical protein